MLKSLVIAWLRFYFKFRLKGRNRITGTFRAPWWLDLNPGLRRVRRTYWDAVFNGLLDNVEIAENVKIIGPGLIRLGEGCRITSDVVLDGRGTLAIGDKALIGFKSVILTHTHRYDGPGPIIDQGMESAPVSIGNECWLGTSVIVLPGVNIGDRSIIAAGGVVAIDIPPGAIAAGVPARLKRFREGCEPAG